MAKDLIERVMKMSDTEVEVKKLTEIKYLQTAYRLDGITYLPHYNSTKFVAPGYMQPSDDYDEEEKRYKFYPDPLKEFTKASLERRGAVPIKIALWKRERNTVK